MIAAMMAEKLTQLLFIMQNDAGYFFLTLNCSGNIVQEQMLKKN